LEAFDLSGAFDVVLFHGVETEVLEFLAVRGTPAVAEAFDEMVDMPRAGSLEEEEEVAAFPAAAEAVREIGRTAEIEGSAVCDKIDSPAVREGRRSHQPAVARVRARREEAPLLLEAGDFADPVCGTGQEPRVVVGRHRADIPEQHEEAEEHTE